MRNFLLSSILSTVVLTASGSLSSAANPVVNDSPFESDLFVDAQDHPLPPSIVKVDQAAEPTNTANVSYESSSPLANFFHSPTSAAAGPPPKPWKPLYFDNNFSYKKDPCHTPLFGEQLKDMPLDFLGGLDCLDGSTLSFGGEIRYRNMDELNRLRPMGPGRSTYDLWRWRNYIDFKANDALRVYVEMLDGAIFREELPATPIDLNRWNLQNAFIDVKIAEVNEKPAYFRVGRQELLYGSQQLVSPLDWANIRRNFEGFKVFHSDENWDVDMFATRPVNTATGRLPLSDFDNERDKADTDRWFSGIYSVYHGMQNQTFDFYWLWLESDDPAHRPALADGNRHTIGMRWQSTQKVFDECCLVSQVWNSDIEGAYQFGRDSGRDVQAGFFTSKIWFTMPNVTWTPMFKALYYWGSGDQDSTDGVTNTFSVLFPLGHAYWGIIDNVSGQNLNNYSLQASIKPHKKLTFLTAMHWFDLANRNDVLYNVAGAPVGAPNTGSDVGEELDLIATYVVNPNFDVQFGYSWFWNGTFINNNVPRGDATQLYVQTALRY